MDHRSLQKVYNCKASARNKGRKIFWFLSSCVPQKQNSLKKIINRIAYILNHPFFKRTFPMTQMVKNLPAIQETQVWSLGQEDPLEKGMATHSSILTWRILQTEEPGRGRKELDTTEWLTRTHKYPCLSSLGQWSQAPISWLWMRVRTISVHSAARTNWGISNIPTSCNPLSQSPAAPLSAQKPKHLQNLGKKQPFQGGWQVW